MSRKDTRNFTGGFIPKELKTNEPRGRAVSVDWTNTSDREESLSDPKWHKRPPTKDRQMKKNKLSPKHTPTTKVIDARNLITGTKTTKFTKNIFGDTKTATKGGSSQTTVPLITLATTATQTTPKTRLKSRNSPHQLKQIVTPKFNRNKKYMSAVWILLYAYRWKHHPT